MSVADLHRKGDEVEIDGVDIHDITMENDGIHVDADGLLAAGEVGQQLTWMDAKIGRMLDALEANGLAENTVVIYTSDHGDSLGEHGLWRKMSMYEASSHIPIQIAWPGHLPAGVRITQPMSNVDVTATIVDIAG
ncbi:MAG: sulfatase-like hydrolase/transferase, partial [Acidobacteria bacterium]|nr:sulfatase-like hydrolase/transferase [Acidobacteriota bacterium]